MYSLLRGPILLIPLALMLSVSSYTFAEVPQAKGEEKNISAVYIRFGGSPYYRSWRGRYYPRYLYRNYRGFSPRYYYPYSYYRSPYWWGGGRGGFYIRFR